MLHGGLQPNTPGSGRTFTSGPAVAICNLVGDTHASLWVLAMGKMQTSCLCVNACAERPDRDAWLALAQPKIGACTHQAALAAAAD